MTLAPDKDEARHVLEFIKANRQRTREWFASILENRGIGSFKQDNKRPFNRNLLFNKNEAGSVTQVYLPSWLDEIKRCHLPLWSLADDDPAVGDLNNYILTFKHEWEDFFQTLSSRFPDRAANLLSDFEYVGLEMFGNLEASIISGNAKTPDAEVNHDVFIGYLPEIKKLFVKENAPVKSNQGRKPSTVKELIEKLIKEDQAAQKEKINRLIYTFSSNLILSSELPIGEDVDIEAYYKVLNQIITKEIELLSSNLITQPGTFCRWQLAVPTAITLSFHKYDYCKTDSQDDDPEAFSETLSTGEVVYIKAYQQPDNINYLISETQKLIGTYLNAALKLSQSIHSDSIGMWKDALSNYNLANHAFSLNRNRQTVEKMSQSMLEAASRLSIDLSFANNSIPSQKPIKAIIVGVSKEGGKDLRKAMKDPGGRPKKKNGITKFLTQDQLSKAFGKPCNEDMIANWEAYERTGGERGSIPFGFIKNNEKIIYSAELRKNPTPENENKLSDLIAEFQSRHRLNTAIAEKTKMIHCQSEESLYQAQKKHAAV